MSFSARYAPAVLLTFLSLAVPLSAQSTNTQATKAPRGSVAGRVTIKDKGAAGVAMSLRKGETPNPFEPHLKATTDHDGFYRFANVPPGSYEVSLAAGAFIPSDNQRAKNVVIGEDDNVEGINFALVRGGVITGKITDADGRPLILQQVNIFTAESFAQPQQQSQPQAQRQPVYPFTNSSTDDRGVYRIYGLRAGRYKVATGRGDDTYSMGYSMQGTYRQVFHPDATDQAKATVIEVTEGSEANNVDIKLGPPLQTFSASGRVVDSEKGSPVPNLTFSLTRIAGQRTEFVNAPVSSDGKGEFVAEGLVSGKYQIYLFQDFSSADLRADPVTFDIIDQDVSNVVFKLSKGATLSGVVVIETEDEAALQKLQQMRLMAHMSAPPGAAPSTLGQSATSMVGADGSFRLGALPAGIINLRLSGTMGPFDLKGFVLSRIERDGVPMPRGIEIKEGEHVGGIRVIVAYGNGSIRGVVKLENGSLPSGVQMYVRVVRAADNVSTMRPGQVDSRGHFLIEGIPPGNYELSVMFFGAGAPQIAAPKREVNVQNGVVADVMLTVDLTTQPKP